ncbi:MAG: iron ABC transporter permease [Nitrospirota bacterium]|nr:iron ABC transporter permease [Nitrospirota bacterium]
MAESTTISAATTGNRVLGSNVERSIVTTRRWATILVSLLCASSVVVSGALTFGAESISFGDAAGTLWRVFHDGWTAMESGEPRVIILLHVRLPRVLLAFMIGACLAAVGVALQALLRNPLADPYVLGISSGAALGAALAMLLGVGAIAMAVSSLPLFAFIGGLLSIAIVYRIAVSYGHLPVHTLLLAGVVLNAIFSALIMFITSIMDPNRSFGMMSWLMGTLLAPDYPALGALALYVGVGTAVLASQSSALNILTLGEESARSLGVEVERLKKIIFVTAALLTGAVVSVSGLIGFVGMVIPHAVRLLVGPDHRLLLPASALVGGMFLVIADALARTLLAPSEIPVGVVTALAGGPIFLYLLSRRKAGLAS